MSATVPRTSPLQHRCSSGDDEQRVHDSDAQADEPRERRPDRPDAHLQELSSSEDIKEFCSTSYGVTFPMFDKIRVNGRSQHLLYAELTRTADADGKAGKVKWNFEKFVVTPAGEVHRFRPTVEPDAPEILDLIEASLPAAS
jgi:hypothetical protein